ncbi:MAG: hypothetical protein ABIQ00_19135 [Chitinophagaceae bacterium]
MPAIRISKVSLPSGEDVHSVLCTHDDAEVLGDLIEARTDFSFSMEKKNPEIITMPALQNISKLITKNPELLIYDNWKIVVEKYSSATLIFSFITSRDSTCS